MERETVTADEKTTTTIEPSDMTADPTATAAPGEGTPDSQDTPAEPEKSAWEKKLDALLEEPKPEGVEVSPSGGDETEEEPAKESAAEPEPDAEPGKEDDDEPLVARLPGREAKDPEVEIALDKETQAFLEKKGIDARQLVERANQATNGYARRQALETERAEIEANRAELEFIEGELSERPVEFMVDRIDVKQYPQVAEAILTRMGDEEFNALLEKVAAWEGDPSERKVAAAKAREEAATRKVTQREETDKARAKTEYLNAVQTQIISLVPEDMPDDEQKEFWDLAATKLKAYVQRTGKRLDPEDVPRILDETGALAPYGLSLPEKKPGAGRTLSRPAPKSPAKGDIAARAKARGQELKERRERRQNAVTVPAGAGTEAANTRPPKGQTFEQRISWIERFGIGK